MKKELIMIIVIIVSVTIGHIVTQNYTKKFFDDIENDLENLETKILSENKEKVSVENDIKDVYNKWKEKYDVLAYYIEHDELEKIETQITLISATVKVEEYEDAVMEMDRCIFLMKHIKDKEALKLVNIF